MASTLRVTVIPLCAPDVGWKEYNVSAVALAEFCLVNRELVRIFSREAIVEETVQ